MNIQQHYIKNNDFKTVLGSGVFGGVTGVGLINMIVFTERVPIPQSIVIGIDEETGAVKNEVSREGKEGIVREMQCSILFDIETAKATVNWLNNHIKNVEAILSERK